VWFRQRGGRVAWAIVAVSIAAGPAVYLLPGLASAAILGLIVMAFRYIIGEWRIMPPPRPPLPSRQVLRIVWAFGALALATPVLYIIECLEDPLPPSQAHCGVQDYNDPTCHGTSGQTLALDVWSTSLLLTALLLGACALLNRRSQLAGRLAMPLTLAGSVIALDLARVMVALRS
jgi:hypothetical protein